MNIRRILPAHIIPYRMSLNAILITLLGIMFFLGGLIVAALYSQRFLGMGMVLTSVGCVCCGLTDGFVDATARGYSFKRVGVVSFAIGIPIVAFSAYRMS
jgi:hypothetical protein